MKSWSWLLGCVVLASGLWPTGAAAQSEKQTVLSGLQAEVYGYVKLDASYDSRRTVAGDLMFFVLPDGPAGRKEEFNMTARETRLGLNLGVPGLTDYRVTGKLETDFYGAGGGDNTALLRMRLAYVNIQKDSLSLMAGQDWDTFITAGPGYAIIPRIVNFSYMAYAGALGLRRPQVRLTYDKEVADGTRVIAKVAAARTIGQDIDGDGQNDGAAAGFPSGQGNLILVTDALGGLKTVLSVSGHGGSERVGAHMLEGPEGSDPIAVPKKDYDSWSLIGSLSQQLGSKLTLQGAYWTGENLVTYWGGIGNGINRSLRKGVRAQGGWAQLMLNATDAVNLNVGYGVDDPNSDDLNPGSREKNELLFGSVFYRVNPATTLAVEYSHLTTSYKDGDDAVNNRVQGSVIFRF